MSADKEMSHEVALMTLGKDAPLQAKGQVGLNHLAFMVESLDLLKDYYRRLQANNVKVEHISDHGISLGIYFRDPDGNGVEVSYELPRDEWVGRVVEVREVGDDREDRRPREPEGLEILPVELGIAEGHVAAVHVRVDLASAAEALAGERPMHPREILRGRDVVVDERHAIGEGIRRP